MSHDGRPSPERAAVDRLIAAGRVEEALAVLQGAANAAATWPLQADLLKRLGRLDDALALREAQVKARPTSSVSEHNLAALLGDMRRYAEAEAAVRRAFAKGGDAPETWLVLARALSGQEKHDEAEKAYRQAAARRPAYVEALRELAQLIWMRTADAARALAPVREALDRAPGDSGLHGLLGLLMDYTGSTPREVWSALAEGGARRDPAIDLAAANVALAFDRDLALDHALAAVAGAPGHPLLALKLAEVRLARGELDHASALLAETNIPAEDQNWLSLKATLERLSGAPDGPALNDYEAVVQGGVIDTPEAWSDLNAYLSDLAAALRRLHTFRTHPVGQSLRHGTQTHVDLRASDDPVIRAFFVAIDGPIKRYLERLGAGDDPLRRRNTGAYRIAGCWSVQLAPNGYHAPHVHPEGWLSSACYIDLPAVVDAGGREGWIGFGAPPFACAVPTPPEYFEKPEPGKLVLFPSYMWHGTVPFTGDETRLTIAFDVVPA
ncbi:putative 2OG-Fe(II) oxygenase [Brevundimonas sp. P7753]|uniref:putative 2OG-Fe(II) oxygenase n=1 Tax=Brevundimonas sp. P7753 TaxID=2726982 RepID=UPI0015B92CEF|nr:putative 2OG-Fe(II) oxygenase [Brevundimonas sp. P7753]NWE52564.1 tetratricopeptide repeat protein [Brevundimonas sp. P7753]